MHTVDRWRGIGDTLILVLIHRWLLLLLLLLLWINGLLLILIILTVRMRIILLIVHLATAVNAIIKTLGRQRRSDPRWQLLLFFSPAG